MTKATLGPKRSVKYPAINGKIMLGKAIILYNKLYSVGEIV